MKARPLPLLAGLAALGLLPGSAFAIGFAIEFDYTLPSNEVHLVDFSHFGSSLTLTSDYIDGENPLMGVEIQLLDLFPDDAGGAFATFNGFDYDVRINGASVGITGTSITIAKFDANSNGDGDLILMFAQDIDFNSFDLTTSKTVTVTFSDAIGSLVSGSLPAPSDIAPVSIRLGSISTGFALSGNQMIAVTTAVTVVPEPATYGAILGVGALAGVAALRRRKLDLPAAA